MARDLQIPSRRVQLLRRPPGWLGAASRGRPVAPGRAAGAGAGRWDRRAATAPPPHKRSSAASPPHVPPPRPPALAMPHGARTTWPARWTLAPKPATAARRRTAHCHGTNKRKIYSRENDHQVSPLERYEHPVCTVGGPCDHVRVYDPARKLKRRGVDTPGRRGLNDRRRMGRGEG
ncbi:Protein of unknown function [Gryllus bimaculatus]|nr:Protein of unknown function [Gryllus bimaculatus]